MHITIPQPCHENWNEMLPHEQGAFCGVCAKTVIDFTKLSDDEVKNYFLANSQKKSCGRFRNDQLSTNDSLARMLADPLPFWKKFLAIVIILFGALLGGCKTKGKAMPDNIRSQPQFRGAITTGFAIPYLSDTVVVDQEKVCTTTFENTVGIIEEDPIINEVMGVLKIEPALEIKSQPVLDENGCVIEVIDSVRNEPE